MHPARLTPAAWLLAALLAPCAGAQVVDTTRVAADSTRSDAALLRELEAAMAAPGAQQAPRTRPSTNPDVTVIGDIGARASSEGPRNVDLGADEVELAFRSVVDPYARADVYLSIANEDGEFAYELEEVFLTTLALPAGLQAKAGKFRSAFGKSNRTHPHALPYIDTPAVYANFFGPEGLNDQGLSLSWLVPNRAFYQELTVEVTRGPSGNESFEADDRNRLLYAGRLRSFWDLSPDATLEVGLSGASGPNPAGRATRLAGFDVTYRWKPLRFNVYRALTLQAEGLLGRFDTGAGIVRSAGVYGLVGYQFARRWTVHGRFDLSDRPGDTDWNETGVSATLGWYLSEFQKLELGARRFETRGTDPAWEALFRLVFVIGTHGAHEY